MSDHIQNIEQEKTVKGTTVLSFNKPTPIWATYIFRAVFILTGIATFIVVSDPGIPNDLKVRISVYLKGLDMFIWAVTRAIGVDVSRDFNSPNAPGPNDYQKA